MRILIAVKSCQRDLARGDHNIIRSTWGADATAAGIDVRFFVGAEFKKYQRDEVHVKCDDSYEGLPFKTREICKWASGKLLDYVFFCDTDTYISVKYMLTSGFEKYDYMGHMLHPVGKPFRYDVINPYGHKEVHDPCYTWASGGVGYFLSKRAVEEVTFQFPKSWAEDLWVGQIVGPFVQDGTMKAMSTRENNYTGNMFSWHFPRAEYGGNPYDPEFGWMNKMHSEQR